MKSLFLSSLALCLFLVSCKDEKKVEKDEAPAAEVSKSFKVTVNAIVEQNDIFQIFYNEDGSDAFVPEQSVAINIAGKPEAQDLVFELPEEAMPASLRFDIGANVDLKKVSFKSLNIQYMDKSITATANTFFNYFYPNPQVEVDKATGIATMKAPKGETYDPILGTTPELKTAIGNLYNTKK